MSSLRPNAINNHPNNLVERRSSVEQSLAVSDPGFSPVPVCILNWPKIMDIIGLDVISKLSWPGQRKQVCFQWIS
ncbi:hypothetical protein TNCV_3751041 [Trichonephila clavipes]|uniref:Uncharacterized protein n=1 Tax=Trichonephila clavipes TaxID=2585209 RepID=A0A8X6R1W7_TRICX|nr:hypothetical protein TNCV_3751041 [Trichonephila clavipes]